MCGLCGALGGGDWTDGVPDGAASAVPHARRAARRARIAAANRVLGCVGLSLAEWQGAALLLRKRTGASAVVPALPALWPAAERLAGRAIDPLDPALLDVLEGA